MREKNDKKTIKDNQNHPFEYVNCKVLAMLLGRSPTTFSRDKNIDLFDKIGFIYRGRVRKYSFTDAAKLAYPELTNYEIARLRVDINEKILEGRKRDKAEMSRSEEE